MTKRELDELFEKEGLEHWEQAIQDTRACSDREIWFCNPDYEWVGEDDLEPEKDMVRVVAVRPEEVLDKIGSRVSGGWDIDEESVPLDLAYIDVARVELRREL